MKYLGVIGGGIGTFLCLIGTISGLLEITKAAGAWGYLFGTGVSLILVILLLGSSPILKGKNTYYSMLRIPLVVATVLVILSLWTFMHTVFVKDAITGPSFLVYIINKLIACAVMFLLFGAPVYMSHILENYFDSDDN